jgi:predicted DNA-binding transcriptional regulator AlpA
MSASEPYGLLTKAETCQFFGKINASTLYRGIREGRYPRPVKVGPGSSRWLRTECESALKVMVERRAAQ